MRIHDPKQKFEQQYMQDEEKSPLAFTAFVVKLAFPKASLPLEIFQKVANRLTRVSIEERVPENVGVSLLEHVARIFTKAVQTADQNSVCGLLDFWTSGLLWTGDQKTRKPENHTYMFELLYLIVPLLL